MSKPAPPTPEQLALAFRQLRRPHWPDTLEAAMAVPLHERCIRLIASRLGRMPMDTRPAAPARPEPPPQQAALPQTVPPRRYFDARRAAANDFDED